MIENLEKPTAEKAYQFIKEKHDSIPDKTMLIVIGRCMVDYHGRARSFLDWGERIIMIKQDQTLLVHQPTMREPVNWQPSDSITEIKIIDNKLTLKSRRNNPPEKMDIIFKKIKQVTVTSLSDKAELVISGMEADVVNEIVKNPEMVEEGLRICQREKPVESGMIDLFCYDKEHTPVIIEVKRSLANISAVHQLRMYVKDMKKNSEQAEIRGMLCAPHIPDMVKNLLSDYNLEWKEVERKVFLPDDYQKTLKDFKK
ncbi:MAG: endonuclease NucS [Candidatus Thermoplasmatota archaeon]